MCYESIGLGLGIGRHSKSNDSESDRGQKNPDRDIPTLNLSMISREQKRGGSLMWRVACGCFTESFSSFSIRSSAGGTRQQLAANKDGGAVAPVQPAAHLHEGRERPGDTEAEGKINGWGEGQRDLVFQIIWSSVRAQHTAEVLKTLISPQSQITKIQMEVSSTQTSAQRSLQLKITELMTMLEQRQTTITRQEEVRNFISSHFKDLRAAGITRIWDLWSISKTG